MTGIVCEDGLISCIARGEASPGAQRKSRAYTAAGYWHGRVCSRVIGKRLGHSPRPRLLEPGPALVHRLGRLPQRLFLLLQHEQDRVELGVDICGGGRRYRYWFSAYDSEEDGGWGGGEGSKVLRRRRWA